MYYITTVKQRRTNENELAIAALYGNEAIDIKEYTEFVTKVQPTVGRAYHPQPILPDYGPIMQEVDYYQFSIPKASGGMRVITAPIDRLKIHQRKIVSIIQDEIKVRTHNNAFAFIPERSTVHALKVHQANESKWFLKLDIKDFFPSCTTEFLRSKLLQLFPLCHWEEFVDSVLSVSTLNGSLPQGAPTSPLLSNLAFVPIDHALTRALSHHNNQYYVYTRYADDILISSRYTFNKQSIIDLVNSTFNTLQAPFIINEEKTRYGSINGRNWNLGLMLNKDNKITIGHKKRERLRAEAHNFMMYSLTGTGTEWSRQDACELSGRISYARMVQPDINSMFMKLNRKLGSNLDDLLHAFIHGAR